MEIRAFVLERPLSPKRLKEILFEVTQVGFRGFLSRISVPDFLQLNLAAIDEHKKLHIRDLDSRIDGQIYLDRGRFIHAEFGELSGEEALYRIAEIERGDFFEDPSFEPPEQSLADILPHKLMITVGRLARPFTDLEDSPAEAETGLDSLFGEQDALNPIGSGITSLFGDDDELEISLQPDHA